ncbi:MAG TPA: serine/threonine-protein kinase [Burkholderiales bacterium]
MAAKKKIGRYKILGELGRGAMGIVYRAQDPALDRVVALKTIILADDAEGREEYQKRFFLEAKAAGKLTHPSIVTTYDFGEQGGVPYLAMELLEGTDLRARLKEGALAPIEAVSVARQVAEGLGFAHERGIVHRDVKPGNIMLLEGDRAKIMDFGLARMRAADHKTVTGMVLGTPKYMSPEQVAGSPVDQRSDLFSLGIVLFEMLTGARLFGAEDMTQIMHNVTYQEHEPPTRLKPQLPAMLDFVVARALKKDPASRYQDAAEFAADLSTCLTELRARGAPAASEPTGTRTVKIERSAEPPSEAPAARAIATDTRLPLARPFDSSAALERLASPSRSDRQRLSKIPKSVGFLRRLTSDDPVRRLFVVLVLAAAAGGYIAWG